MKLDFIFTKIFVKLANAGKKKELPKFCEFLEKFNCGPLKKLQSKAEIII